MDDLDRFRGWWSEDADNVGEAMVTAASAVDRQLTTWHDDQLHWAECYFGRPLSSIKQYLGAQSGRDPLDFVDPYGRRISLNLIQSIVDTLTSKIAKNRPRPFVLTTGGDWDLQKQAKDLTKFIDGEFRAENFYRTMRGAFRDAGVFGTGVFWLDEDVASGRIRVVRMLADDVVVDPAEAVRGVPANYYMRDTVWRGQLLEQYGKDEKARKLILAASGVRDGGMRSGDMIDVWRGWAVGERYCVAIEGGTLYEEEWDWDWPGLVLLPWREPVMGVWGQGVAENLIGVQREINRNLEKIRSWLHLGSSLRIFHDPADKLAMSKLSNAMASKYATTRPPTFHQGAPPPRELFAWLEYLSDQGRSMEGVSELSASGRVPAALNSGEAQRVQQNIESERFAALQQTLEETVVTIAERKIAMQKRMLKRGKSVVVLAPGTRFLREVDFANVDIDESRYSLATYPTSVLPSEPSGRIDAVMSMFERGLIQDRDTAAQLIGFPDTERPEEFNLAAASIEYISSTIDKILDGEGFEAPEPFIDMARAQRMGRGAYLRAKTDGAPAAACDDLARWLSLVDEALAAAQAAAPPAPAPGNAPASA